MGKGDRRTRRGKLFRGTHGNTNPTPKKVRGKKKAAKAKA